LYIKTLIPPTGVRVYLVQKPLTQNWCASTQHYPPSPVDPPQIQLGELTALPHSHAFSGRPRPNCFFAQIEHCCSRTSVHRLSQHRRHTTQCHWLTKDYVALSQHSTITALITCHVLVCRLCSDRYKQQREEERADFISARCTVFVTTRALGRQFSVAGELHVMPTFIDDYVQVESRYFRLRQVTCLFDETSVNNRLAPELAHFLNQVSSVQFYREQYCIITSMWQSQLLLSVGHH